MSPFAGRALDPASLRGDFPILSRQVRGRRLVYLDNAATTQKPRHVLEAETRFYETANANIHRGIHTLAEEATARYEEVRGKLAAFLRAPDPRGVVFTRNCTEAINLVARSWGKANLRAGDEILLTVTEHHSNMVPWLMLAKETGAVLRHAGITDDGKLDLAEFRRLLGRPTKLVAVTHVSNVLGTINPVAEITAEAKRAGALVLVDAAQSVPHMPVDFGAIGCDFLALSAHKMYGPTGVGALVARPGILEGMEPFLGGGSMIREVRLDGATWAEIPRRFEAGTPNIAGVVAFGAALDYLGALGMEEVRAHELGLTGYALERLSSLPGITIYGPREPAARGGLVAFTDGSIHPHDLATVLDSHGVAIRAGHHCTQPLHRLLGVAATARASFAVYNGRDDVDALLDGLVHARSYLGRKA